MAVETLGPSTDETESRSLGMLQKTNLVTRRVEVDMTREDADRFLAAAPMPGGSLTVEVHLHVLGKDVDIGILLVGGIAILVNSDRITEQFDCISKTMIGIDAVTIAKDSSEDG